VRLSRAQRQRIERIARGRSDESLYLLEGARAVRDALSTGAVAEIWLRADLADEVRADLEHAATQLAVPVGEGAPRDFERLSGTVTPQGVLALVRDTAVGLEVLAAADGMLLWLDGLQDPGNVGAVVRVAAAFGLRGVVLSRGSADPLGLKALRASVGLALRVPFARAEDEAIAAAVVERKRPVWILERDGEDVFSIDAPPGDLVLVLGSEAHGAGAAARAAATGQVGIPIAAGVDSLNAAVAAGIAVAALTRSAT
jgi:TrmH family RNA methyltransferase